MSPSNGTRTASPTSPIIASTAISKKRGEQTAIIWEGDDPNERKDHLSRAARACLPPRQRAEGQGRQERRPRHDLHADDPRGGLCDARLRADRRDPFGRLRRLLARFAGGPHRGLRIPSSSSPPMKACAAAGRFRSRPTPTRPEKAGGGHDGHRHPAHRRRRADEGGPRPLVSRRDGEAVSADCPPSEMNAEDPLFILYTSGSTGKPKGVLHTTGGYLVYVSMTHQFVFDYHDGDIYWCTADVGWVTGHSYIVYGPLAQRRDDADVRGRAELSRRRRASGRSSTSTRSTSSTPRRPRSAR